MPGKKDAVCQQQADWTDICADAELKGAPMPALVYQYQPNHGMAPSIAKMSITQ